MENFNSPRDEYFALLPSEEIAAELSKRVGDWYENMGTMGIYRKMRKSYAAYYGYNSTGQGHTSSEVVKSGEQGELSLLKVNHLRNLLQHMLVMTTSSRPAMDARAVNTDYRSIAQTLLANGILDYYMREKKLEKYLKTATEYALIFGEGYIRLEWDASQGDEYSVDPATGRIVYTGDIKYSVLNPLDVIKDVFANDQQENDWIMVRHFKNRFELIAKYPELKEEILKVTTKDNIDMTFNMNVKLQSGSDLIPVFEFYHRVSEALPNGRQVIFVSEDAILYDGALPYKEIPVYRIAPGDFIGTPHGYTVAFDLLALQDVVDALYSIIVTNQTTFGVQNILLPQGHNMSYSQLSGNLNILEYDPSAGKPEALQLTATPAEVFKFVDKVEATMETISGVNSVARGNPEANLRSGNALALIQSMAIQFNSGLQQSYAELIEDVGTATLTTLRDFGATPRVAMITGKNNRSYLKEFSGSDLDKINRVVVDVGNPLAKCLKIDTPVLMLDGSIKKVQDIITGEQVMGLDSQPRTVESVTVGEEEMFDIYHAKLQPEFLYGCNKSHILSLQYCAKDGRYGYKQYEKIDISVGEFLKWPVSKQRKFMGYRTGVEFAAQDITVPAYHLGLWLGDGHSNTTALTTMDEEIKVEWTNYAKAVGHDVRIQDQPNNKSKVYFITSGESHGSNDRNKALNDFRALNVINNKHIPQQYKINSTKVRLEILAGILDTDGSLVDETFVLTQKNDILAQDVVYLARSLGFKVTTRKFNAKSQNGTVGEYTKVTIGGATHTIPTRLARKQAKKTIKSRAHLNYAISIKSVGQGKYYGFTLKEEPHFLLGDFTVTHNTTAGKLEMANNLLQQGLIKTPEDYILVMKTGNLDTMLDGETSALALIDMENERLRDGQVVKAVILDNHILHIKEHQSITNSTDARENPDIVNATLAHIQEHINMLKTADPNLLQILGMPSLASPQGPGALPPPPQAGPGGPPPGKHNGPPQPPHGGRLHGKIRKGIPNGPEASNVAVTSPDTAQPQPVGHLPHLPHNPLTKQRWNPTTGGLNQ